MATPYQLKRGLSADWTAANPTLAEGEIGIEITSTATPPVSPPKIKIGDGVTQWNSLPYSGGSSGGGATVTFSTTAPTTAIVGDIWIDSNTGIELIYVNDGTSSQWVELNTTGVIQDASATQSGIVNITTQTFAGNKTFSGDITTNNYYMAGKNVLINSTFDFWQRGTSFSTSGIYTADRWYCLSATGVSPGFSQQVFSVTGNAVTPKYYAQFISNASSSSLTIAQALEDVVANSLKGKTVTLSFYYSGSGSSTITATIDKSGTANAINTGFSTISTTGAITTSAGTNRATITATIPNDTTANGIRVTFATSMPVSSSVVNLWGVQLEVGSVATPFTRNSPNLQSEFAACQRYYYRIGSSSSTTTYWGNGHARSTGNVMWSVIFPVRMRTAPTSVITTGTASDYMTYLNTRNACSAVPGFSDAWDGGCLLQFSGSYTQGDARAVGGNTANAFLAWDVEL